MKEEKSYHTKQKQTLLDLFKSNPGKCFTSREIISDKNINISTPAKPAILKTSPKRWQSCASVRD